MAALPGAHRRARSGGPRLRGHAVGRPATAGVPRVPARLVAQPPALRDRTDATRALRAAPTLDERDPQLDDALARAPLGGRDAGAARRVRPRFAGGSPRAGPGARGGRPTVRGRDGPNAPRPRPARAPRERVSADEADRGARRPRDAARTRRGEARRP